MDTNKKLYEKMGISGEVLAFGGKILSELTEVFREIDETAEYNELKVIQAMSS